MISERSSTRYAYCTGECLQRATRQAPKSIDLDLGLASLTLQASWVSRKHLECLTRGNQSEPWKLQKEGKEELTSSKGYWSSRPPLISSMAEINVESCKIRHLRAPACICVCICACACVCSASAGILTTDALAHLRTDTVCLPIDGYSAFPQISERAFLDPDALAVHRWMSLPHGTYLAGSAYLASINLEPCTNVSRTQQLSSGKV